VQASISTAQTNLTAANTALEAARANLSESEAVELVLADSVGSIVGFYDLQNDGAAILKMTAIRDVLVIQTETDIFLARYTQNVAAPFDFQIVRIPENTSLFYRNTPILVNGLFLLYAARNGFMRFDLSTQIPYEVTELQDCQSLFFSQAKLENTEKIFSMDNAATKEIYVCFPSTTDDKSLRFDYEFHQALKPVPTVSTTSASYTAGSMCDQPGGSERWFVMGASGGKVLKYGLVEGGPRAGVGNGSKTGAVFTSISDNFSVTDIGKTILLADGTRFGITSYASAKIVTVTGAGNKTAQTFSVEHSCTHRDGEEYDSVLESGVDGLGGGDSEKLLIRYVPMLSSFSPQTPVAVTLRARRNPNEADQEVSTTITPPNTLVPVAIMSNYIGDRITVSGKNNPVELVSRIFHLDGRNSKSFSRRVI